MIKGDKMRKIVLILGLFMSLCCNAQAQTFSSRVNRTDVPEGETFLLTVELSGAKSSNTPDFSVLNKDFTVYSVSNSFRTNIINGNVSQAQQWNLVLMPNKTGKLEIPTISLDKYQTKPLFINAGAISQTSNPSDGTNTSKPRFKIEADIDNKNPFVQQQINYTLTLYDTGGLQGEAPIFLADNEEDWIVKSLGSPQISTKNINGQNYREIKFYYALFPQKSGALKVPEVRFNGYYLTKDNRRDPFADFWGEDAFFSGFRMTDVFATRNPVVLTAKSIDINVRPAPTDIGSSWWLPAEEVHLYSEFVPQKPNFKVGEAVTRNIYVQATGVIDSQLPELKFKDIKGIKQYPEKPRLDMNIENGKIVAMEQITNVYIPSQSGRHQLPEINIPWFNVKTQSIETATLPAMEIVVAEGETSANTSSPVVTSNTSTPEPSATVIEETNITPKQELHLYIWLIGSFVAGIMLCALLMFGWNQLQKSKPNYQKQVVSAAKSKDLRLVRDALLSWGSERFPSQKILSLQDIDTALNDKEFRCELDKLTEALYAQNDAEWNEFSFIKIFNKICKQKRKSRSNAEPLPKLYK